MVKSNVLHILGHPSLEGANLKRPVPLLLLAYLAVERGRHKRRELASLFWPETPLGSDMLSPLAEEIVDLLEIHYGGDAAKRVVIPLPRFGIQSYELDEAHSDLKRRGFVLDITIVDNGAAASYLLTPQFNHQLNGTLGRLARTNLRNALFKLKSIADGLVITEGQEIWTEVETDLDSFKELLSQNKLDDALTTFRPLLEGIETRLTRSQYELGTELTLWLEGSRTTLIKHLRYACLADAKRLLEAGRTAQTKQRVVKALNIPSAQTLACEGVDELHELLHLCTRSESPKVQGMIGIPSSAPKPETHGMPAAAPPVLEPTAPPAKIPGNTRAKLWQVSARHLSSLLDPGAYDEQGRLLSLSDEKPYTFIEQLFVATEESEAINHFVASSQRGLFLIGPSGSGKSNLLCHSFFSQRRQGTLTVFLSARMLSGIDFVTFLKAQVFGQNQTPQALGELLEDLGPTVIYLDAINECNAPGGAIALIERVSEVLADTSVSPNLKIIASCRTETWKSYQEVTGGQVETIGHLTPALRADVLSVGGFQSERSRKRLFSAYQQYHNLSPKRYEAQSQPLRNLIKSPFAMRVVAESYSNRKPTQRKQRIPSQLDYVVIFRDLTQRKLRDALKLLNPSEPEPDLFKNDLRRCLFSFSHCLYTKLVRTDVPTEVPPPASVRPSIPLPSGVDAMSIDELAETDLQAFMKPFSVQSAVSPFAALVQLNLIEETTVSTTDFWGEQIDMKAYKFYHDRYAQYWLAAVLNESVLGRVNTSGLLDDPDRLGRVCTTLTQLLESSKSAPLLVGAAEVWLHTNMVGQRNLRDYLVVLCDRLATSSSGLVSYHLGWFLHNLVEQGTVLAKDLYQNLFLECGLPLKQALAYTYLELWPRIAPADIQAFIEALDSETDSKTLHTLADIFVELYRFDATKTLSLLGRALYPCNGAVSFLTASLGRRQSISKQLAFVAQFALKVFHYSKSSDYDPVPLKAFLLEHYHYPLQSLILDQTIGLQAYLKPLLYKKLEDSGVNSWEQASSAQGNSLFFIVDNGIVQRDELYAYYPFVVALHNGDYHSLSLRHNRNFQEATLRMLTFRSGSVIGYVAAIMAASLVANDEKNFDLLLEALLKHDSKASRFSLGVIATQAAVFNPNRAAFVLERLRHKFVPYQLARGYESEEVFSSFISVAATDLPHFGRACRDTLDEILFAISESGDVSRAAAFGDRLVNSNFHPQSEVGHLIVEYLLARKCLDRPQWKVATQRVLAGMLARNPNKLHEFLKAEANSESIIDEVRQHLDNELLVRKDQVSYQMSWNWFFVSGWETKQIRFHVVRDLLGGLVNSNSVEDFAKGYRRFLVELAKSYMIKREESYSQLSASEAHRLAESSRQTIQPATQQPG